MLEILLLAVTLSSMLLVVYHHAIYPLILRAVQRSRKIPTVDVSPRQYDRTQEDDALPHISILIPAYNEAAWIQAKIYNLVVLDYPSDKLKVVLACDGCTDDTAAIARHCMAQPECADLNLQIREFRTNRGKVAVILAPYVAKLLADEGRSKADVKRYLHEHGCASAEDFEKSWLASRLAGKTKWPAWVKEGVAQDRVPAVRNPDDITVIVAGGDIPIPQSAYLPTWGFPACRIAKKLDLPHL